ncbi:MAG: DegT/DnrJ/EryC1/StrS family aminotransferase [Anaeromyxobacteraceae bacterium]|nr:DegT/DnrJ/EryC1/StrS family aminotransferase [Anaeromyxobacteraceae bacterium]
MGDARIPVLDLGPELDELRTALDAAWARVLDSRQFIGGPEVEAFETEVAEYLGVKHAVGVNSGTDALVISLRALGVGPGDEVITVPFSFFATVEAICSVGATPVFVDVDPRYLTMDPDRLEAARSPRTRAVIPVHLYGQAAELEPIVRFCEVHRVALLEDVAQAMGGTYAGRRVGTFGRAGAFSFFPSKNLGGLGDGGLIGTDNDGLAEEARALRAHGARKKYFNEKIGYNSRLDALQAAILRAKLPRVDDWNAARRVTAARYREALAGIEGLELPAERPGAGHVYHQFTVRVGNGRRDALRGQLAAAGIDTMVYYPRAIHELPHFGMPPDRFPVSAAAAREVLSLPLWPSIGESAIGRVASELRRLLR